MQSNKSTESENEHDEHVSQYNRVILSDFLRSHLKPTELHPGNIFTWTKHHLLCLLSAIVLTETEKGVLHLPEQMERKREREISFSQEISSTRIKRHHLCP